MNEFTTIQGLAAIIVLLLGVALSALFGYFSYKSDEEAKLGYGLVAVIALIGGGLCFYYTLFPQLVHP